MEIAIIVLHYKNINDTMACLRSVAELKHDKWNIEVVVINNDGNNFLTLRQLANRSKNKTVGPVKIINNLKNLGYAGGVNIGIKKALSDTTTDYILILNNDTVAPPDLLEVLLKDKVDITSPIIKFKSLEDKWVYDFGGKINWWTGRTKHIEKMSNVKCPWPGRPTSPNRGKQGRQMSNEKKIDYVSGCCMLIRREVFEKVGLFDERYFFYFEDVDFCVRAKKAGFRIAVNPKTAVYHKLGGSIGRWTGGAIMYNLWGNFIFITKHLGIRMITGYLYLLLLSGKIVLDKIRGR